MKVSPGLKKSAVLLAGTFFCFAPLWAPHFQQLGGKNLFVTADSMVLLGVTLLVSLLGYYLLPGFMVSGFNLRVPSPESRGSVLWPVGYKLLAISFLLSQVLFLYWVNQHILHSFLSSADEHSCYFLAECLRKGKLYVDMPPLADFFKVVHVGMRDGKWFSVYPLGWPLIWAFGLQFNIVDWLNPVMSALAIFFFYLAGSKLFGRLSTVVGLAVMVVSPFFIFTSASYFSHSTCLLCISLFLYAFLRWREAYKAGKDPVGWALLCGFAVGYGLMTRYLTMAAIAGPFLLYHYLPIFFEWKGWSPSPRPSPLGRGDGKGNSWLRFLPFTFKRPRLRKSDWIVFGIIAVFMILILYQNYLVTGKAFRAPNKHDKSWERLGFRKDYTPLDGLIYTLARVFYLMDWFAPAIVALYLVILFQFSKRKAVIPECFYRGSSSDAPSSVPGFPLSAEGRIRPELCGEKECGNDKKKLGTFFRLSMVFIAFAYFFYYSWGGNQWGPRYLWEGMPFLCIAVSDWVISRWRVGSLRMRKFLMMFLAASVITSWILFAKHAEFTEEASRQRKALYDLAAQSLQRPSIVFIRGFLGSKLVFSEDDAIRNSPFLDGKILYAHDLGEKNRELGMRYPDRDCYRGSYDRERKQPLLERLSIN